MALTLAQIITRIEDNTGRDDKSDTQIVRWLNDGMQVIARYHDWDDLIQNEEATLTEGTYRYAFPTDMKTCYGLRIIDGTSSRWLTERTKYWLMRYDPYPDDASEGKPIYYCVDGDFFELYPPPDDGYTIYINFARWPTAFAATSTTATADITYIDDVIVAFGTAEYYRSLGQFERANHWESLFWRRLGEARRTDMTRPNHQPTADGVVSGKASNTGQYWNNPEVDG